MKVQGKNSGAHLTEFDSSLTIQNSNFHNGSRILAKIKVVEEEKMHNFRFGRKLIWSSDQQEKHRRTRLNKVLPLELD